MQAPAQAAVDIYALPFLSLVAIQSFIYFINISGPLLCWDQQLCANTDQRKEQRNTFLRDSQ